MLWRFESFAACLLIATSLSASAGLIHRYSFDDGTANDSVGTANGTFKVGANVSDGAVTLGGDGGFVELPQGLVSTLTNFTISAWVKADTVTAWSRVFDFGSGIETYMHFCGMADKSGMRFAMTVKGSAQEQRVSQNLPLYAGIWTHIAITLSNTTAILYVNGTAASTNPSMTLTPASLGVTKQNSIGKSQYPRDATFKGQIDELLIFDQALSPAEIIRKTFSTGTRR